MSKSLLNGLIWRRAVKHFGKATASTPKLDVNPVLEAIHLAPSSFGITPYQVHCVTAAQSPKLLKDVAKHCFDNEDKVANCDALLAFAARTDAAPTLQDFYDAHRADGTELEPAYEKTIFGFLGHLDEDAFYNWAALQTMVGLGVGLAAAADAKIASCPMQGFDPVGVHGALGLPSNQRMVVLMAMGHESDIPEEFAKWRFPQDRVLLQRKD